MKPKKIAVVNQALCAACGVCQDVCPKSAIKIHAGSYAVVDNTCLGCGLCSRNCPGSFITMEARHD